MARIVLVKAVAEHAAGMAGLRLGCEAQSQDRQRRSEMNTGGSLANVAVDRDFARFGSKSYAINKINSVDVRKRHPYGQGGMLGSGLIAVLCLLGGAATSVLAIFFGALAVWLWQRSKIVEYQLFLTTSSQEAQAFVSRDPDEVIRLRNEIERAMASH